MNEKFDLRSMLEEIKKDEEIEKPIASLVDQDEIEKMIRERDSQRKGKSHDAQ